MVKDKVNEVYTHDGVDYTVGSWIVGTKHSDYPGVIGVIKEITDEEGDVDIWCDFITPTDPDIIKRIEDRFSYIYDEPRTLNDICFDDISMMIDEIDFIIGKPPCYTDAGHSLCSGRKKRICKECSLNSKLNLIKTNEVKQ